MPFTSFFLDQRLEEKEEVKEEDQEGKQERECVCARDRPTSDSRLEHSTSSDNTTTGHSRQRALHFLSPQQGNNEGCSPLAKWLMKKDELRSRA